MKLELSELLQWGGAVAAGFAGWVWRENVSLRASLASFKTHVAETYVTKVDNDKSLDRVYAALERIEKKLDER